MKAIFLNTFYAENLSGASFAVNKRLELFSRHYIDTKIMTTIFYPANRYYFEKHFPSQKEYFVDFINVLTNTINVDEKIIVPDEAFFCYLGFKMNHAENKAFNQQSVCATWKTYPDGRILEVSYYNRENEIIRTDGYDYRGFLCMRSYYEVSTTNTVFLSRREHLNSEGVVLLTYYFTMGKKLRRIICSDNNEVIDVFDNENELILSALKKYTNQQNEQYFVISDLFLTDTLAVLSELNQKNNVALFIQLHNIQYKKSLSGQNIRIGYSYPVLNNELYSGLIALTDRQKKDIHNIVKYKDNIYTIPENWFSKTDVEKYNFINWDKKEDGLVIISARLEKTKQIDQAIKAIVFAHKRVPKIHLEIWGSGPEKNILENMIKHYHAEKYIYLKGTTSNSNMKKRLAIAQLHLLTSKNEGLPMVLFEAQMGKTPSICYDIDYGPDAIIINRINGDLLAPGDTKYLSMRLEELFDDQTQGTLRQYAFNTRKTLEKYSEQHIWFMWEKLIERSFKNENTTN